MRTGSPVRALDSSRSYDPWPRLEAITAPLTWLEADAVAIVGWALLGCILVAAIFAPLAVRTYSRKM